ncbi:S-layer homology domain-containing protein [Oscillospiraceae bacterium 21-37]
MKKKLLSLLLTLLLTIAVVPISANAVSIRFNDVSANAWYADSVQFVYEKGLMSGVGAGKFNPNGNTTRGQLVTILYRLEENPSVSGGIAFTDVNPNDYFSKAVQWASANKIVSGVGNNKFAPNSAITREQMVTILYRYSEYKSYDTSKAISIAKFADFSKISKYALSAMRWANASGLISGVNSTTVAPTNKITRAETAAILMRFCEKIVGTESIPGSDTFPVRCEYDGDTIFTVYVPAYWRDNYTVTQTNNTNMFGIRLRDKENYDAGFGGHMVSFYVYFDDSYVYLPRKDIIGDVSINGKRCTLLSTGPTDVQFDMDRIFRINCYKEKEADVNDIVKSIDYTNMGSNNEREYLDLYAKVLREKAVRPGTTGWRNCFALGYVNEDDVPDLLCMDSGGHYGSVDVYYYKDGKLEKEQSVSIYGEIWYLEKGGVVTAESYLGEDGWVQFLYDWDHNGKYGTYETTTANINRMLNQPELFILH